MPRIPNAFRAPPPPPTPWVRRPPRILVDHERRRLRLLAIYHSHPQHEAYFSAEDRKQATVWDEPSYPDAAQIVVSVFDGMVKGAKAFRWNEEQRDFVEVELRITEPT